jgi:hypothetical protein
MARAKAAKINEDTAESRKTTDGIKVVAGSGTGLVLKPIKKEIAPGIFATQHVLVKA